MKRYIILLCITPSLLFAVATDAIDVLNARIVDIETRIDMLANSDIDTKEALSKEIDTLKQEITALKAVPVQENPKRERPQQLYPYCICTHGEGGGSMLMHSAGTTCLIPNVTTRSVCEQHTNLDSPDLKLRCSIQYYPSLQPPLSNVCVFKVS